MVVDEWRTVAHPTLFTDHPNCLTATAGLPATTVFDGTLLLTTDPAATTEFSPMLTPFKMVAFIPIQTLSAIFTGAVFNFGRGGRFLKYGARACASIRRWAGNQAMRSDLDLLLGHNERAVQESEIADCALAILSNRKRAAGVARDVFADHNCARSFADQLAKNLCALAVKSFAKFHIFRDRLRPPIAFYVPILSNVAHKGKFPEL